MFIVNGRLPKAALWLSLSTVVLVGLLLPLSQAEWIVRHLTYWVLLLALGGFAYGLWSTALESQIWQRNNRGNLLFCVLCGIAMHALQPAGYKVVMDEPLLIASSRQLHLEKAYYVPERCYELGGAYYNFDGYVDKRPGLYPFLLGLLHDLSGYRSNQGFLLNALLAPMLMFASARLGGFIWPRYGPWLAPVLVLTVPLFSVLTNSSGLDLLNAVLIVTTAYFSLLQMRLRNLSSALALIFAAVLLVHTRYESLLYLCPAIFCLILVPPRSGWRQLAAALSLASVLLLPAWHMFRLSFAKTDPWQTQRDTDQAFSLAHLPHNFGHARDFLFSIDGSWPASALLTWLSLAALCAAFLLLVRGGFKFTKTGWSGAFHAASSARPELSQEDESERRSPIGPKEWTDGSMPARLKQGFNACMHGFRAGRNPSILMLCLWAVCILANFVVLMSYHWGDLTDPAAMRLAAPLCLLQVFLVLAVTSQLPRPKWIATGLALAAALWFGFYVWPLCRSTDFLENYPAARWAEWTQSKAIEWKDDNVLIITQPRLAAVVEEVSAISIDRALRGKAQLDFLLQMRVFDAIYVLHLQERISEALYRDVEPLESHFQLDGLELFPLDASKRIVLSRLQSVRLKEGERIDHQKLKGIDMTRDWFELMPAILP